MTETFHEQMDRWGRELAALRKGWNMPDEYLEGIQAKAGEMKVTEVCAGCPDGHSFAVETVPEFPGFMWKYVNTREKWGVGFYTGKTPEIKNFLSVKVFKRYT